MKIIKIFKGEKNNKKLMDSVMNFYDSIKEKLQKAEQYQGLKKTFLRAFSKGINEDKTILFNLNMYIDY